MPLGFFFTFWSHLVFIVLLTPNWVLFIEVTRKHFIPLHRCQNQLWKCHLRCSPCDERKIVFFFFFYMNRLSSLKELPYKVIFHLLLRMLPIETQKTTQVLSHSRANFSCHSLKGGSEFGSKEKTKPAKDTFSFPLLHCFVFQASSQPQRHSFLKCWCFCDRHTNATCLSAFFFDKGPNAPRIFPLKHRHCGNMVLASHCAGNNCEKLNPNWINCEGEQTLNILKRDEHSQYPQERQTLNILKRDEPFFFCV